MLPAAVWLGVFFLAPLGVVAAYSLATTNLVQQPIYGWHFSNYSAILQPYYLPTIERTVEYAALTTILCALLGYPMAYTISRYGGRWKPILVGLVLVPWLVDYLVRIYAWFVIMSDNGLINSALHRLGMSGDPPLPMINTSEAVIVGLVYGYFPLMVLPVFSAVEQLPAHMNEAAKDLGAGPRATFFRVILPLSTRGLVAGSILVFLPALGDFATAQFLGGPDTSMVGNLINQNFVGSGYPPYGAALTMLIVIVLIGVVVLYGLGSLIRARMRRGPAEVSA